MPSHRKWRSRCLLTWRSFTNGTQTYAVHAARLAQDKSGRLLLDGLRELGFRIPVEPLGAFYIFADARAFDSDSLRLAYRLLERAKVGITPGVDFGEAGEGWLRFCYANSEAAIHEALERLARALPTL